MVAMPQTHVNDILGKQNKISSQFPKTSILESSRFDFTEINSITI